MTNLDLPRAQLEAHLTLHGVRALWDEMDWNLEYRGQWYWYIHNQRRVAGRDVKPEVVACGDWKYRYGELAEIPLGVWKKLAAHVLAIIEGEHP